MKLKSLMNLTLVDVKLVLFQDVDGYICPEDMRGIVKLFVPDTQYKDEEFMRDLIDRMDRNNDGMIAYEEFVQTLKEMGEPDFFRSLIPIMYKSGYLIKTL